MTDYLPQYLNLAVVYFICKMEVPQVFEISEGSPWPLEPVCYILGAGCLGLISFRGGKATPRERQPPRPVAPQHASTRHVSNLCQCLDSVVKKNKWIFFKGALIVNNLTFWYNLLVSRLQCSAIEIRCYGEFECRKDYTYVTKPWRFYSSL